MAKLSDIFDITYGNKFDLNKMIVPENGDVCFVARTSKNLGVVAKVKRLIDKEPYPEGLITVALGGAMLSSFIQQKPFYTAQNIAVLISKRNMTFQEKLFYCVCIQRNKFRYSTFGREANRTLKKLEVPLNPPKWVETLKAPEYIDLSEPIYKKQVSLTERDWKKFTYDVLFDVKKGKRITNENMKIGVTPCIRPIDKNNGVFTYIDLPPNHQGNTITVNYNGSIGETFYQPQPYFALDDINILYPKFELDVFIAMFLVTVISREKYRYSYGRKWKLERMNKSLIELPVTKDGNPDWEFMRSYIKSIKYSKSIQTYSS